VSAVFDASRVASATTHVTPDSDIAALESVEQWFAQLVSMTAACAVASGTAGLEVALRTVGITYTSRVALPAYDWVAGLAAVRALGAQPVWIDVGPNGVVTPTTVAAALGDETVDAIVVTDLHGYPVDVLGVRRALQGTAAASVPIVEDATQAVGASRWNVAAGSHADFVVWSLGRHKTIDVGHGGIVAVTAEWASALRRRALSPLRQVRYGGDVNMVGTCPTMHPDAARRALAQFSEVPKLIAAAQHLQLQLRCALANAGVRADGWEQGVVPSGYRTVALHPNGLNMNGITIGSVAYRDLPPLLNGDICPPEARRWGTEGRVVSDATLRQARRASRAGSSS
jgi:dTDP-4-amino-4,6-dideoxygalactose transaminase